MILYVVNVDWFFLSHRLPLALEAIKRGEKVYLLAADTGKKLEVESYGIHFINIPFQRSGKNILHEWKCINLLRKYYKELNPEIIHHVTLKAALLGSIAAKLAGKKNVVNAISGLGYNFTNERNGFLQKIIIFLMKKAFRSNSFYFILQNPDDINMMKSLKMVPNNHYILIKGSGVNLQEFPFTEMQKKEKLTILFPARILYDKGIIELIKAAKLLYDELYGKVLFVLVGDCDVNNNAVVPESELKKMLISNYIVWNGYKKDMVSQFQKSDIVVLPSYREGLPKSLIEACAIGRPIITTDTPGCKECVLDGYNGYIVPPKSIIPLKDAIEKLSLDKEKRIVFGKNSRALAEKEFSIQYVIEKTFSIYEKLTSNNE